jgi:hypothetical protein
LNHLVSDLELKSHFSKILILIWIVSSCKKLTLTWYTYHVYDDATVTPRSNYSPSAHTYMFSSIALPSTYFVSLDFV